MNLRIKGWTFKRYFNSLLLLALLCNATVHAMTAPNLESQTAVLNNLPRVALLVKEQYVDPKRINPGAMLASILDYLESRITKLVISLPKSLESAREQAKASEEKQRLVKAPIDKKTIFGPKVKEQLILDLGGTKKSFIYELQRSIWGMVFYLVDILRFVEKEAKKQRLTEKSGLGEEPLDLEKSEIGMINAMLGTLDPHSLFLEPKFARDLELTTKGKFDGVGIVLGLRDGFLTVISAIDGTPASIAGVKAKDRIIKIDDDSAINMGLNEAVSLLRGVRGTIVKITAQRSGTTKDLEFSLKRDVIKVESVAYTLIDNHVGYVRVKAFQGNTAQDVKDAILKMKKKSNNQMNGLIFDLRGNPGGLLREAVEISSLFLDGGEVVSTQGSRSDSRQVEMAAGGELDPNLKLVVLVDGGSASASEIVAGAIKNGGRNNGRGIVVGERTFGKGSVQMLFDFPVMPKMKGAMSANREAKIKEEKPEQPAALKLTIAEYFGPNNTSIQTIGVSPDIGLAPVYAAKREEIRLFPEIGPREIDLEGHLSFEKPRSETMLEEKPLINIEYFAPKSDEDGSEYSNKLNLAQLKKDFAIVSATEFLKAAKGPKREDLLSSARAVQDRLQKQEQKKITEALGKFNIDWSLGQPPKKGALQAGITLNQPVSADKKLKVGIKVKNTSSEPLFQVHGITHSKTQLFDQKEFLFGKLAPGQEIERFLEFEIPKDVISRRDLMTVEIRDQRREKIQELDVPIQINGLGRPRFAHMFYLDDRNPGNVELTVWLKNVGDGKAFEPTVLVKNESGSKVFLKNGRAQAGELLVNQETSMKFAFKVKEPTDSAKFEIQIFDGKMNDLWRDKISVNVAPKQVGSAYEKALSLKVPKGVLLEQPDQKTKVIATLLEGVKLSASREINGYFLVKVDSNLTGFVKKSDTKEASTEIKADQEKKKKYYSVHYDRTPAQVKLTFGDKSGIVRTDSGTVHAEIDNPERLSSVLLYVNGKKVLYKDMVKSSGKQKFDQLVHLRPGINVITLLASEDNTYGHRESITVFYDQDGKASIPFKDVVKAAVSK